MTYAIWTIAFSCFTPGVICELTWPGSVSLREGGIAKAHKKSLASKRLQGCRNCNRFASRLLDVISLAAEVD